jgi:hypothetical protein
MVDEVEYEIIDSDEREQAKLVVRWFGEYWSLCHAKSYKNAFHKSVNHFKTRGDAVEFAEDHDCTVEKHSYNGPINHE